MLGNNKYYIFSGIHNKDVNTYQKKKIREISNSYEETDTQNKGNCKCQRGALDGNMKIYKTKNTAIKNNDVKENVLTLKTRHCFSNTFDKSCITRVL